MFEPSEAVVWSGMKFVRRSESGAGAVEAALLMPLITLILLGIVEFGLLFRDVLTVQTAARDGARTAAAHSRETNYQELAIDRITQAMSIRGVQAGDVIVIYKSLASGLPAGVSEASAIPTCRTDCDIYKKAVSGHYVLQSGTDSWSAPEQNACPEETTPTSPGREYVGVFVSVDHKFITGQIGAIFTGGAGDSKQVFERVVMRLEPRTAGDETCKP